MNTEIIEGYSTIELAQNINTWLSENSNIEILSMTPYFTVLHELYYSDPNTITNQWQSYTMTILFKEKEL